MLERTVQQQLEDLRETHRFWSTNNARAMSALNRDLMEARNRIVELEKELKDTHDPRAGHRMNPLIDWIDDDD